MWTAYDPQLDRRMAIELVHGRRRKRDADAQAKLLGEARDRGGPAGPPTPAISEELHGAKQAGPPKLSPALICLPHVHAALVRGLAVDRERRRMGPLSTLALFALHDGDLSRPCEIVGFARISWPPTRSRELRSRRSLVCLAGTRSRGFAATSR